MLFEDWYLDLIEGAFFDGSASGAAYGRAYESREALGARLGTDSDDPDVVALVEGMEAVQKEVVRVLWNRWMGT